MVKAFLASRVRNNYDWLLMFLILEAFAFFAQIYFLNLAIFDLLIGFYNFFVLTLFHLHLNSPFGFFCHPTFHLLSLLKLLNLLLKLFLA